MKILMRIHPSNKWEVVESADYSAETELQKLLAESPSLIAINEIREESAPLVAAVREVGLPGSGNTDLLAFSPRGDIVIVECKLAANAEIKRKVIAQVLEYGAYLWGMSYEDLNKRVYLRANKDLAQLVAEAAGDPEWDEEGFRGSIEENLSKGAFILVIAVDVLNDELSRTIRFLNACGHPEFAFTALEMRRYQKDNAEILVPHIFGSVQQSIKVKPGGKRKQWTPEEFFAAAEADLSPQSVKILRDLYDWTKEEADRVWFGVGTSRGSITFHYLVNGKTISVFSIYSDGKLILNYGWLSPLVQPGILEGFHQAITAIPTLSHIPADFTRWPAVSIEDTFAYHPEYLLSFKEVVEELGKKVHSQNENA